MLICLSESLLMRIYRPCFLVPGEFVADAEAIAVDVTGITLSQHQKYP